jgi:hypothetical protein
MPYARLLGIAFVIGFAGLAHAWPDNAALNQALCIAGGEQTTPRIAALSDGGVYVAWFDQRSGTYAMYLQRLSAEGDTLWAANGLLISGNPQATSLQDFDLIVDSADCAILAFDDTRAGTDRDIYAYRISPEGIFLWGPNGIVISSNANFEAEPRLARLSDESIGIVWFESAPIGTINIRKLDLDGNDMFTPPTRTITSTFGCEYQRIVAADSGSFIVCYVNRQGSSFGTPRHIYMQRVAADGAFLWGTGTLILNMNVLAIQVRPLLEADSAGGAFVVWYDTRAGGSSAHVFAQRVANSGVILWPVNGVQTDNTAGRLQFEPTFARIVGTQDIAVFYRETNAAQSMFGIGGQRVNSAGVVQWTAGGAFYFTLDTLNRTNLVCAGVDEGAVLVYKQATAFAGINTFVKSFGVDGAGANLWSVTMCSVSSEKIRMTAAKTTCDQVVAVWPDGRNGNRDIYLQDVNADGTLGDCPIQTIDAPIELTILVSGADVILDWGDVVNAASYNIYSSADMLTWNFVANVLTSDHTIINGAASSTLQYYQVTAVRP